MTTIAFGSDHAAFDLKETLKAAGRAEGYTILDCGPATTETVDYPDLIPPVIQAVREGATGVLLCGSGIGMSIGANRFKGIRAALCLTPTMATLARAHNDANILILGSRLISPEEAVACLHAFLSTPLFRRRPPLPSD